MLKSLLVYAFALFAPLGLAAAQQPTPKPAKPGAAETNLAAQPNPKVLLQRGRAADPAPPLELAAEDKLLQLRLARSWLDAHPLTRADLEQERDYLKQFDLKLQVRDGERLTA